MKKYILVLCGLIITALCVFIIWRAVFMGTYEMHIYSRILVSGHYESDHASGFLKSQEDLSEFLSDNGSTNRVLQIDYDRYMWIYSPFEIDKILHSIGSGMIFIQPTEYSLDDHSYYLVRVRRREAAGPKPMTPAQ